MWINFNEAQKLLNVSMRTLYRRLEKKIYETRQGEKSSNGRPRTEIKLESLPARFQVLYYKRKVQAGEDVDINIEDIENLSEAELELAFERFQLVREMDLIPVGKTKVQHLEKLAKKQGVNVQKLYRYKKRFAEVGIVGMVKRRERADINKGRSFDREAINYLKKRYFECKSKTNAYKDMVEMAYGRKWDFGSYSQAMRILKNQIDEIDVLKTYMQGGDYALKQASPCILRDFSDLLPLEYICFDHKQFDVMVYDEKQKKIVRPWLTAGQDLRTRALWGWHINRQPNSRTIALAIYHGVLNKGDNMIYGLPRNAYVDNGKDFKSLYLSGDGWKWKKLGIVDYNLQTKGVFIQLGIEPRYALPFNPGSKPIERAFETFDMQFFSKLPGYVAGSPEKRDGAQVQSDIDNRKLLTYDELKQQFTQYIKDEYHRNNHTGQGMENRSPINVWQEHLENGFVPATMHPDSMLILLLFEKKNVTVGRNGVILNTRLYTHPALGMYWKAKVDLRYDPEDPSFVHVFCQNKYFLTAKPYIYGSMHDSQETISERMRQNRAFTKQVKEIYKEFTGGVKPSNKKGNSVRIKKTLYDDAAKKIEEEKALKLIKTAKNWNVLPPDDWN